MGKAPLLPNRAREASLSHCAAAATEAGIQKDIRSSTARRNRGDEAYLGQVMGLELAIDSDTGVSQE
jgi:hypothetical protein